MMHLVQFDMIRLQTAEGAFQMAPDFICRETAFIVGTIGVVVHGAVYLGGKHDFFPAVAALFEPAPDDFLR
ncbi:hypothetical protein D3C81_2141580 [compost metagenome]